MKLFPLDASDADLLAHVEQWIVRLEAEDYDGAFAMVEHDPDMRWTPQLVRTVIKSYGDALPTQRVTLAGDPSDRSAAREVTRFPSPRPGGIGYVWYDLNIDGRPSDLTATFSILPTHAGLILSLDDIHVM